MTSLMTLNEARNKYLDFSAPLYVGEVQVVMKRPVLEPDIAGFVKPLSLSVWLMLVAVIVLTALAYTLMLAVWRTPALATPCDVQDRGYNGRASVDGSMPPLLWSLAVLLSQSTKWEYSAASLRVVASVWFMASLILSTVYEANLKAMLIKPRIQLPFDNLQQLDQSQYPLYVMESTAVHTAIAEATEHSSLGRLKDQMVTFRNMVKVVGKLYAGHRMAMAGVGFTISDHLHYTFSRSGFCLEYVMQGDRLLDGLSQTLGFRKGSSLRPRVDDIIIHLREAGILNYLLYRAMPNSTHCTGPLNQALSTSKLRTQSLKDFYGVFACYLAGNLLAILAFVAEVIKRHGNSTKK